MQYIQIDLWPAGLALAVGCAFAVLLHATARLVDRAVRSRTLRAVQRAIEEPGANPHDHARSR